MRDYTDLMNMPAQELVAYALECAKLGVLSVTLTEALAHQLETEAAHYDRAERLQQELDDANNCIEGLESEMFDLKRQIERMYT